MLKLTVGIGKEFLTITEALQAIPYETPATIYIAAGVYFEKLFCDKQNITLIGAGATQTIISWDDFGLKPHPDGRKYGTFRSYTAFFGGKRLVVKDLTIKNTAKNHEIVGQAIAAYVDVTNAYFDNVHFDSEQDTLFCAPLPLKEREVGGFFGPRGFAPRHLTKQFYNQCQIIGNVDFIFGGADALFQDCEIISKSAGYVAAPSGNKADLGFVFRDCRFIADAGCDENSVYLARPWREDAKVAVLNCHLGAHIHATGFAPWHFTDSLIINKRTTFIEIGSTGKGANPEARVPWMKKISDAQLKKICAQLALFKAPE